MIDIPDHTITAVDDDADTWGCACGERGEPDQSAHPEDPYTRAEAHADTAAKHLLGVLDEEQLGAALTAGAGGDSRRQAAVGLLVRHQYWLGNGYLRRHLFGQWEAGRFLVYPRWDDIRVALDQPYRTAMILEHDLPDGDPLGAPLRTWTRSQQEKLASELVRASTSEVAILRIATSLATTPALVVLAADTNNLGHHNRGLVLTALAHLLSHGGQVPVRTATHWADYDQAVQISRVWLGQEDTHA